MTDFRVRRSLDRRAQLDEMEVQLEIEELKSRRWSDLIGRLVIAIMEGDYEMADSILGQLKSLSKDWKSVKPQESGGFVKVPDGDYQVECKQARLENAKKSGRLQIAWMFRVISGDKKGKPIYVYQGLDNENNLGWAKGTMKSLGVEPPKDIVNMPKYLEKCLGKKASATVTTQGEYTNTYINPAGKKEADMDEDDMERLEDLDDDDDEEEEDDDDDDDDDSDEDDDDDDEDDEEEPRAKKKKKKLKKKLKKRKPVDDDDDEDDEDEED